MSAIDTSKLRIVEEKADIVLDNPKASQILKFVDVGDRISYVGSDDKYRSGGFIMTISPKGNSMTISGGPFKWAVSTSFIQQLFVFKK